MSDQIAALPLLAARTVLSRQTMVRVAIASVIGGMAGIGCGLLLQKRWEAKLEVLLASPPPSTGLAALIPGGASGAGAEYELFTDILASRLFLDSLLAQPLRSPEGEARSVLGWYMDEDSGTSARKLRKLFVDEYLVASTTEGAIATISVQAPARWLAIGMCSTVVDLGGRVFLATKDAQNAEILAGSRRSVMAGIGLWSRDADTLARWKDRNRQVASPLSSVSSEILVVREGASRMVLASALGGVAQSTTDSARRIAPVRPLSRADAPVRPSWPSLPLLAALGFVLGGLGACAASVVVAIRRAFPQQAR